MRLTFDYTHDNSTGYGRMGTQTAKQMQAQGVEILGNASNIMWAGHSFNARGWIRGQRRNLLTMWETTRMPELVREGLHNLDQVFVPSLHNVELYTQYHSNVKYVPLGVDPEVWRYRKRQPLRQSFRFLADGRSKRKGADLSVEAFKAAFKDRKLDGPEPTLMMKGHRHSGSYPGVQMVSQNLSDEAEVALYGSAHVFLAPARGEGWGLCPLQAIAQGCPTILTDHHGHAAFSDLGWGINAGYSKSEYTLYGESGEWWEPDFDQLVDTMRWMYDNYDKAEGMAKLFSAEALGQYTWANTAADLIGLLELDDELVTGPWVEANFKTYPTAVLRPHTCQIAGITYSWETGRLYYEPAEVKRTLFEAGLLDPSCLEMDDSGLTPDQHERAMSASQGHCPTCLQPLNSKPFSELTEVERSH